MSIFLFKFISALSLSFAFVFFVIGIAFAFRWLKFPDLTGDGSFTLGGVLTAKLLSNGISIEIAILCSILAGFASGIFTAAVHQYLKVPKILAGILTLMALYTVNLRILGRPNMSISFIDGIYQIFSDYRGLEKIIGIFVCNTFFLVIGVIIVFVIFESRLGLEMRIAGANPHMASMYGISNFILLIGLGISNSLISFSGSLIAQMSYSADINMGTGQIIIAIAALFIGMTLFRKSDICSLVIACILGAILFMLVRQLALEFGLQAQDFKLFSTLIVLFCVSILAYKQNGLNQINDIDDIGI